MNTYYMGSDTEFGWFGSHIGHFLSNAAKVAGREVGHATHALQSAGGAISGAIGKIPIVGAPVHTVMSAAYSASMAPLQNTVDAAIHGKNIGKAALDTLHAEIHSVRDVAPYAKMAISLVPGVGTGVSAALGAGMALASGQPIDKALLAGAIDAMPGGAMAHAAASAAAHSVQAAARGEKLSAQSVAGTLLNSLPVPPGAKEALMAAGHSVGNLASGKTPPQAPALQQTLRTLPPEVQKAYATGLALGTASVLQVKRAQELLSAPVLNKLTESGIQASKAIPAIAEARKLAGSGTHGFDLAQGLLGQHSTPFDIQHLRASLKGADLKGFDMGLATRIGLVANPPRGALSAAAQAGRALVHGIQGLHPQAHSDILKTVQANASASVGGALAAHQIAVAKEPWYTKLVHVLGFGLGHGHPKH